MSDLKKVTMWKLSQMLTSQKLVKMKKILFSNNLSILIKHTWMEGAARETKSDLLSCSNLSDLQNASNSAILNTPSFLT